MIDGFGPAPYDGFDDPEEEVGPGPPGRHAVWVVAVTAAGVALGWWSGLFRIGPEEYGLPSVVPGPLLSYLAAWTAVGLVAATVPRAPPRSAGAADGPGRQTNPSTVRARMTSPGVKSRRS